MHVDFLETSLLRIIFRTSYFHLTLISRNRNVGRPTLFQRKTLDILIHETPRTRMWNRWNEDEAGCTYTSNLSQPNWRWKKTDKERKIWNKRNKICTTFYFNRGLRLPGMFKLIVLKRGKNWRTLFSLNAMSIYTLLRHSPKQIYQKEIPKQNKFAKLSP